ncbi:hypothetical protein Hanom_Chr00s000004g01606601 [Helianthus anomalus]
MNGGFGYDHCNFYYLSLLQWFTLTTLVFFYMLYRPLYLLCFVWCFFHRQNHTKTAFSGARYLDFK